MRVYVRYKGFCINIVGRLEQGRYHLWGERPITDEMRHGTPQHTAPIETVDEFVDIVTGRFAILPKIEEFPIRIGLTFLIILFVSGNTEPDSDWEIIIVKRDRWRKTPSQTRGEFHSCESNGASIGSQRNRPSS